ncbi:MAG TPA: endonuclease/exonuclease/phosphatase family protein [Terriglobia bacterium]|nr:endonuclease/exonuclease/phosphatase family protein [Terriglobia bacterium]
MSTDQSFRPLLKEFARFESTRDLERSPLYQKAKPDIDRFLARVWEGTRGQRGQTARPLNCGDEGSDPSDPSSPSPIHAVAWNIERGMRLDGIIHFLQEHPLLAGADVLLLSELDWGMARTGNRCVAGELAEALEMNYAFAPCYLALSKGAGIERHAAGDNQESLHGNALLSRFPIRRAHSLALPNGKDKMKGAEKRIGSQRAVIADIEHPMGTFRAVSLHLDAHSSQRHRYIQMKQVLDHLDNLTPKMPVLIGGDWNTTTHDASRAVYSILGYCRRVMMGIHNVVANHYPHPDRWFDRKLFRELERRRYAYRTLNTSGECTLHYNVADLAANLNMSEWVPAWCFWFINWALKRTGGSLSMKLDWFAGRDIQPLAPAVAIPGLATDGKPVSDHDPIVLSFTLDSLQRDVHGEQQELREELSK